ncbi:MAG TPA: hypothetical protein VF601_24270 [Beijerinckiaceae bacterium]|jgi:hypothetical protein
MEQALHSRALQARRLGLNTTPTLSAVIAALLFPSVIWIFKEQMVWPWDQAWYAEVALGLAHAAGEGPVAWLQAMLHLPSFKAPLLQWLAQASTGLAGMLGSYERSFLLLNVALNAATLALVFSAVLRLHGSLLAGLAAVLLCGGASLFIAMTHQFVVEPLQALTIAGLMRLSLEAGRLPTMRLTAATAIWVALAILAKTTSVGFIAPFLVYIVLVRLIESRGPVPAAGWRDRMLAGIAALTVVAAVTWYAVNWSNVLAHIRNATVSDVALHYGSIGTLGSKLRFWSTSLLHAVTPWPFLGYATALVVAAALGIGVVRTLRMPIPAWFSALAASGTLFALCLFGTVAAGLLSYASQINEETRFLTPMIPLIAVLVGWSLSTVRQEWLAAMAVVLFAGNTVAGHLHAHGAISLSPFNSPWLKPYQVEPASVRRLEQAVRLSCDPKPPRRFTIVGVEKLDFNANSAAFFSEKQKGVLGYRCAYTSLGYAERDLDRAVKRLQELADYFVTLPTGEIPDDPKDFLNQVSKPMAEWIANSPDWERITDPAAPAQVFRRRQR